MYFSLSTTALILAFAPIAFASPLANSIALVLDSTAKPSKTIGNPSKPTKIAATAAIVVATTDTSAASTSAAATSATPASAILIPVTSASSILFSAAAVPVIATPAIATPAIATPAIATPSIATPSIATPAIATLATPNFAAATAATAIAVPSSSTTPATEPTFYVRNFRAFMPDASEPKLNAWIMFSIADGDVGPTGRFETRCSAVFNGTLYDEYKYHGCERQADHPDDMVGFRVSEGFDEVVLKRQWRHGSMYLTGYAPEGTWWSEAKGGNVTTKSYGKIYERMDEWKFTMKSVAG